MDLSAWSRQTSGGGRWWRRLGCLVTGHDWDDDIHGPQHVRQPVLLLRPRDEFWDMTGRAEAWFREVRRVDLPEQNGGLFDTGSVEVARYAREFLDR
mgnify:CR=1 FL=1